MTSDPAVPEPVPVLQPLVQRPLVPGRTPEVQAQIEKFQREIGAAMTAALNLGALKGE